MNLTNSKLKYSFMFVMCFAFFSTTFSCKKEGCTDPDAENYDSNADEDDGNCTYARTKFLGSYSVNETCGSDVFTYSLTIVESSTDVKNVVINNFGDFGINIKATVNRSELSFNETVMGINVNGTGTISGNSLTIIYSGSVGGYSGSCTKTCIKQ